MAQLLGFRLHLLHLSCTTAADALGVFLRVVGKKCTRREVSFTAELSADQE
jgi:hypothetical protein